MPEAKGKSDTEPQKQRRGLIDGQRNPISPRRRMLSIGDVPFAIGEVDGKAVSELPAWLGDAILSVIQQLKQDSREKGGSVENVQILIEAIKDCRNRLTTVAQAVEGKLQLCQNEDERGRARKKRYEFMKQIWGSMYFKITDGIQELGTYINQDVELQLRTSCEMFRVDMGIN